MRYFLAALLALTACTLPTTPTPRPTPEPTPEPAQSVTLTAPVTQGEVPLTVTFTADASPTADTFRWTIGGAVQEETTRTLTTTFDRAGLYVIGVSVGDVSDSVTVRAEARATDPGPDPSELKLTQTPGGPEPWAVRYTVSPVSAGLLARCREGAAFVPTYGAFVCVHEPGDTVQARVVRPDGEVTATVEASPEVTENEGVAFAGRWRYSSRGTTETFRITEGSRTMGESADGRFKLFTIREDGATVVEFTIDGRTVVLTPVPEPDGRQVYEGRVYGLVLEPLADSPEEGDE